MNTEHTEVVWIESRIEYSIDEVAALSGLPRQVVDDLVDCGALQGNGTVVRLRFETEALTLACAASRLRDHFEIDGAGLAVAVSLLRRVRALESALVAARATTFRTDD